MNQDETNRRLARALRTIYQRDPIPEPWSKGGNLPWNNPAFSQRMLAEHLDQSHGAASRVEHERTLQIDWLWAKLELQAGMHLCDITCGPGLYAVELAKRGCIVTGIDFSPAAIAYARTLAKREGVAERCEFIEEDVRASDWEKQSGKFDAALFLYGQLGVFRKEEAQTLLGQIAGALKPGGKLAIELLNQERIDKKASTWWYSDDKGLWGNRPFLHLGERFWDAEQLIATERFYVVNLEQGAFDEIVLSDQSYALETMSNMLHQAEFGEVHTYLNWDGVTLYDAQEWVVYVGVKA